MRLFSFWGSVCFRPSDQLAGSGSHPLEIADCHGILDTQLQATFRNAALDTGLAEFRWPTPGVRGADIGDCVQEFWCEVTNRLVNFEHLRTRPGLRAWMYRLVKSVMTNLFRRRARQMAGSLQEAIEEGQEPCGDTDPAAQRDLLWRNATFETILAELRSEVSELSYRVVHAHAADRRSPRRDFKWHFGGT